jgi:hypothetical protein
MTNGNVRGILTVAYRSANIVQLEPGAPKCHLLI